MVKKQKEDFLQPHTWQEKEVFSIYTHSACHGRSVEKIGEPDYIQGKNVQADRLVERKGSFLARWEVDEKDLICEFSIDPSGEDDRGIRWSVTYRSISGEQQVKRDFGLSD